MESSWLGQVKAILLLKRDTWKLALTVSIFLQVLSLMSILLIFIVFDSFGQFGNFPYYSLYDTRFHRQMANKIVVASPDTAEVQKLMTDVKQLILDKTNQRINVEYYTNSTEALNAYENNKTRVFAGIVFNYNNGSNLTYALRFPAEYLPSTDYDKIYTGQGGCRRKKKKDSAQENDEGLQNDGNCSVNNYLFTAFSILQISIDTALIREETGVSTFPMPNVLVQMLPKAAFLKDTSSAQIGYSIVLVIAFVPTMLVLIFDVVYDKQTKMKDALKIMGVSSSVLRLASRAGDILAITGTKYFHSYFSRTLPEEVPPFMPFVILILFHFQEKSVAFSNGVYFVSLYWSFIDTKFGLLEHTTDYPYLKKISSRVTYLLMYIFISIVTADVLAILSLAVIQNYYIPMLILLYGYSIVALAFLFTPFFNKATTATATFSWSLLFISSPYVIVILTRTLGEVTGIVSHAIPVYGRCLLCLLSPVAFAIGVDQAIFLELRDSMAFVTASQLQLPLYGPLIMLLVDVLLYFALAVYFDSVISGEYGPWYKPWFIFAKANWSLVSSQSAAAAYEHQIQLQLDSPTGDGQEDADVEEIPDFMLNVGITIRNLIKTFEVRKEKKKEVIKAVDGLSLTIYQDQITAILGHNGAGKTTLLNILTGMTCAASGSARVLGLDVSDAQEAQKIRQMTGFCPQDNMFYPNDTCQEHLRIFARIKGIADDQVEQEINTVLKSVGLKYKKDTKTTHLSGGEKRKLSVAGALLGNPKIIILDEPTAGMDPYSRRQLWTLLKEKKKGRVILISTHFMDEADILADRKAIISKGSLICCGSSLFLKNRFGQGYHLNMVVEPDCDTQKVSSLVSSIVSGSEINRMNRKELDITLPYDGVSKFSELFSVLENSCTAQSLGVNKFGVSMTTLEEVFLKIEEDIDMEPDEVGNGNKVKDSTKLLPLPHSCWFSTGMDQHSEGSPLDTVNYDEGRASFIQKLQTHCLLRAKQFFTTGQVLGQLILPAILLILGLILFKNRELNRQSTSQQSPLTLSPAMYTKTKKLSNQNFPYNTIPRLLIRDTVNSSLSRKMIGNLSTVYEVDQYDDSYYNDMFKLLNEDVSPHYIGAEFENLSQAGKAIEATYKVMYNDSAHHSIPATIALVNNFLLMGVEMFIQGTEGFNKSIEVSSWPWPKDSIDKIVYNGAPSIVAVFLIGTCFCIIAGELSVDPAAERTVNQVQEVSLAPSPNESDVEMKIRRQLRISCKLYWLTFFVVDFIKFFIPMIITIIVVFAIQIPNLMPGEAAFSCLLVCLFFILSSSLFAYVFSYRFVNSAATYYMVTILLSFISFMSLLVDMEDNDATLWMRFSFSFLLPQYNIFGALYYIDKVYQRAYFKNREDSITIGDYFSISSHEPICYLTSILHIILFYFWLRKLNIRKSREAIPASNDDKIRGEDEDVTAERERVREMSRRPPSQLPVALVENLRKQFKDGKVAVRNQTFAVEAGEVFGLLGPNGSGKTTTLNMITADICPDRGKVMIGGYDIRSNPSQAFQAIGYCPQQDALWPEISLKGHLEYYAKIRGIPTDRVSEVSNFFIDSLKLEEHETIKVKHLSGGTKRKLSYCLSMLGKPSFVLLDEPSTGMDPRSKILLWNTISKTLKRSDRGAILTTHSMEEADRLCSRIAIMVNGTMRCLGTSQHLKSKFGNDYCLEIKLSTDDDDYEGEQLRQKMKRLNNHVKEIFPKAVVTDQFSERVRYKIPKSDVKTISRTFSVLEQGREKYDIAEYSFTQSTLEQVFLEVSKKQLTEGQTKEEDEEERQQFLMSLLSEDSPSQQTSTV